jgi:hypothetical protein
MVLFTDKNCVSNSCKFARFEVITVVAEDLIFLNVTVGQWVNGPHNLKVHTASIFKVQAIQEEQPTPAK